MIRFPRTIRYEPVLTETVSTLSHPDCDGGVTFVVYQKSVETAFSNRTTRATTAAARCARTGTEIPAMAWTDAMERALEGVRARATLAPASYRIKPEVKWGFAAGAVALTLASIGTSYWVDNLVGGLEDGDARVAAVAAAPAAGDYVLASDPGGSSDGEPRYHWYVLRSVTDEAVRLQPDPAPWGLDLGATPPDLRRFTGATVTVPREGFLQDGRIELPEGSVPVWNALKSDGRRL